MYFLLNVISDVFCNLSFIFIVVVLSPMNDYRGQSFIYCTSLL